MIIKFITYFSILNLLLISIFILIQKGVHKSGIWIFATSMLIVAYTQWIVYLFFTGEIKQFYYLAYTEGVLFYLFVPMFYLYIRRLLGDLQSISWKQLVHLIPIVPGLIYYIVFISGTPQMRIYSIESKYCGMLPDILLNITGNVIQVFYILLSFKKLNQLKKKIKDNFSNFRQTEIQWIYFLLFAFSLLSASYLLLINIINNKKQVDLITLLSLDCLFFAIFIKNIIYSFNIVPIIEGSLLINPMIDGTKKNVTLNSLKEPKYKLAEKEIDNTHQRLINYMVEKKPYLDANLNLTKLSSALNASSHNISLTLNIKFKQNFFDFINLYRIKEAMRLLDNLKQTQITIEAIGFESGFNSKTAFYRAFKKYTNLTPSAYIESLNKY